MLDWVAVASGLLAGWAGLLSWLWRRQVTRLDQTRRWAAELREENIRQGERLISMQKEIDRLASQL